MHATTVSLSTHPSTAISSVPTPVAWNLPPLGWKDAVKVPSHSTPGAHYWLSPGRGLCTCPSCVKGGRFCRHLREYRPQPPTIRVCPFCQVNPCRDFIYCSEVCAANAALRDMEDEAFAVNVAPVDEPSGPPSDAFCRCVHCATVYTFSDEHPLLCPDCRVIVALSTPEEEAETEATKAAVLAELIGIAS